MSELALRSTYNAKTALLVEDKTDSEGDLCLYMHNDYHYTDSYVYLPKEDVQKLISHLQKVIGESNA